MSESVQTFARWSAASLDQDVYWSDTRDPSNSLLSSREPIDYREKDERVTGPDATAIVMLIALAITAIGLSASGVIYLFGELLSYRSMDLLDLIVGTR